MSIIDFGEGLEDKWMAEFDLGVLQKMVVYNNHHAITIPGRNSPIHLDKNGSLYENETEFKKFPQEFLNNKNILVEISEIGRIKIDGEIKEQYYNNKCGLIINIPGQKSPEIGHRIVALTWRNGVNTSDKYNSFKGFVYVHHLNNNAYDNNYKNLLWVTPSQHEMIHINGIWTNDKFQLSFLGDNFLLNFDAKEMIKGKFIIQDIDKNEKNIIFKSNKKSILYFERPNFGNIIIKSGLNFVNDIDGLTGNWKLKC
jgi:hypothetical protein